jgi:hypothetical protein
MSRAVTKRNPYELPPIPAKLLEQIHEQRSKRGLVVFWHTFQHVRIGVELIPLSFLSVPWRIS